MTHRPVFRLASIAGGVACAFLVSADVLASADVFMCQRAAKFGFSDALCDKPATGFGNRDERLGADKAGAWKEQLASSDEPTTANSQGMTHWQSEWGRRNDWDHVHGWNSFQAFYPFTGRFDHDWFQFALPHPSRRPVLPPARRENPRSDIR